MTMKSKLILLPGLLSDQSAWQHQLDHLADQADMQIPDLSTAATPDAMLSAIMDKAPKQFALAGHSMGAWLALEVMKKYADRVTKLCILSTSADKDSEEKAAHRKTMIALANNGEIDKVISDIANTFIYNQASKAKIKSMFVNNSHAFINQQKAMLKRHSCVDVLATITQPTLVILGKQDNVFHEETLAIANAIPKAKLALIDECGHMSMQERPQTVTALMRYWLDYF